LFGQIRGSVLALLYGRADSSFYLRQIARHVHASPGSVQRELKKLAEAELVVRKSTGNQVFYQANQRNPVFAEMRALLNKTVGLFRVLHTALRPLADKVAVAFVYGSIARQEEKAESDIDLMIVGRVVLDDVLACLTKTETALGRAVNPTVYSVREFKRRLAEGNHFLNAVIDGKKVFLIGNEDELREMAGVRMEQEGSQQISIRNKFVNKASAIELTVQDLSKLLAGLATERTSIEYDDIRRWSYGDVENNGVYYHPQLTHYAHQVFEQFFFKERGLQYADLSGRDSRHEEARLKHTPKIEDRITFPVAWLHQWMLKPMQAGDIFRTWIDTVDLAKDHIGVRALVYDERAKLAAVVIWVRWAVNLPGRERTDIPEWFPRRA